MKRLLYILLALCLPVAAWAAETPKREVTPESGVVKPHKPLEIPDIKPKEPPEAKAVAAQRARILRGARAVLAGAKAYVSSHHEEASEVDKSKPVLNLNAKICAEMALRQNPQAQIAQDDVDAVEAKIGQVMAQWKPQISARYAVRRTDYNSKEYNPFLTALGVTGSSASGGLGGGGLSSLNALSLLGTGDVAAAAAAFAAQTALKPVMKGVAKDMTPGKTTYTEQVTLKQVLYAGGQISAGVKASKFLAESQEWQRQATLDRLEYQAKQAYYDCLLANALVVVAEESVVTFKRHLSDAQQMFNVGMVSGFEVLRAKTELGSRESGLVAAKNAALMARANLKRVISVPQDQPIALQSKIDWVPITMTIAQHVKYAYQHRPEILALEKGIAAADQDIRRVRGEYKPQIAGQVQYTNTDNAGAAVPDGWTFSVGADLDIYPGGKRKHEMAEARARRSKLEHQLVDMKYAIELDVRQARIQVDNAISQIQSEQGNVDLGREGLRLAELRFQEGVGTQVETLDAELALSDAESKLAQALRDYGVAHAALDRALGVNDLSEALAKSKPKAKPAKK